MPRSLLVNLRDSNQMYYIAARAFPFVCFDRSYFEDTHHVRVLCGACHAFDESSSFFPIQRCVFFGQTRHLAPGSLPPCSPPPKLKSMRNMTIEPPTKSTNALAIGNSTGLICFPKPRTSAPRMLRNQTCDSTSRVAHQVPCRSSGIGGTEPSGSSRMKSK